MKKKLLSIVILSFAIIFAYFWFKPKPPQADLLSVNTKIESLDEEINKIDKKKEAFSKPASEKKKKVKGYIPQDSPNMYAEWYNEIRTLPGEKNSYYSINYRMNELLKARKVQNVSSLSKISSSQKLNWRELGPGNVSGRTRSILIDPKNHDIWYVGSVSGGVWKTINAGKNWTNLTKDLPNLATSSLGWSLSNTDIIYVGTGEGFGNLDQIGGSGIWKTIDGGSTWEQLISTTENPEFGNVMRMAVDPNNPDIVVVAVLPSNDYLSNAPHSGIYRTEDGGKTWVKTYDAGYEDVQDLRANPKNFNTQYAAVKNTTILKSTNGGKTWVDVGKGISGVERMELAISPSDTNKIYVAAQGGKTGSILYSSYNSGNGWVSHTSTEGNDVNWLDGQGWYDNTIAVNPYNSSQVFVGGVQLWQLDVSDSTNENGITLEVDFENTKSFLEMVNWGASFADGGLDFGYKFHELETNLENQEYTSVEVRFGSGKKQKAHRFFYGEKFQYTYQDYVDVPFEVWDISNNRQLMVSFRDSDKNGKWNLEDRSNGLKREYVFIHSIKYNPAEPNFNITKTAGMAYKNTYAFWAISPAGNVFDPANIPNSLIRINVIPYASRDIKYTIIADGYHKYKGSTKGVHVDHHNIVIVKTDTAKQTFRLVNGNDGGVSYSDNKGATFSQTGDYGGIKVEDQAKEVLFGYNTTQFYGVDKANGAKLYIGGMQDNGSWLSPENPDEKSKWRRAPSGDGFEAAWNYGDSKKILESSQYNNIYRTTTGGKYWYSIRSNIDNGARNAPFFTKIAKSKQDPDLVFTIGASGVWRSEDFGDKWSLIKMPAGFYGKSSSTQIKISLHNPQIVWSGRLMRSEAPPFVSTDGGLSFKATNVFTKVKLGYMSGFATHPKEDSTAFALFSTKGTPKILKTTDLGNTWTDISGFGTNQTSSSGFPDVVVFSLLVMPYNTDIIWAGTEIGLFESTDGGATWKYADSELPPVGIYEMLIVNDEVVVATHGRGVWAVSIPELNGYEPDKALLSPRLVETEGGAGGFISAKVKLISQYDSSVVIAGKYKLLSLKKNEENFEKEISLQYPVSKIETIDLYIKSYKEGKIIKSSTNQISVFPLMKAEKDYANNFNEPTDDFFGVGLKIDTPAGFNNGAVHSPHDYENGIDLTYTLKIPIIVSDKDATIKYEDVAIVEPSDEGVVFGDVKFWDYVVLEGSNNKGKSWQPLLKGYDARFASEWLVAYNTKTAGDSTMFKSHTADIRSKFNVGEEILIRFRLHADRYTTGWGWVFDNVSVQGKKVGIEDFETMPVAYKLEQNYPNPFNPSTTIKFAIPKTGKVLLKIYDVLGKEVSTLINKELKAGSYSLRWDASHLASGIYIYNIETDNFRESKKMILMK